MRLQLAANAQPLPSPGMNTMVTIFCLGEESAQLSVPGSALLQQAGKTCVFIYNPADHKISLREVVPISLQSDGRVLITCDQLKQGDLVVSSGVHYIKEGETVKPLTGTTETNVGGLL